MSNILKLRNVCVMAACAALLMGLTGVRLDAQLATATILGTVTDTSGAVVPGTTVRATNVSTGTTQSTTSDAQGRYRIPDLAVASYDVQTEKTGFQTVVHKGITLTVGGETVVDFALPVGQVTQTVTVESEAMQVETTSSEVSSLISETQIRDLPLNGRNFEQLIDLAPGVLSVMSTSHSLLYGNSNTYSVSGSRPNGQAVLMDDTDMQSYWNRGSGAGMLGTSMGIDAIAEFQTLTNTYGAQFGGNGGAVNIVSRSGTNNIHGSAYEFLRNDDLDAKNFFNLQRQPFRRNQFGGTIGGAIKKDKMFFFGNYEGLRQLLGESKAETVLDGNGLLGKFGSTTVTVPSTMVPYLALYSTLTPLPCNGAIPCNNAAGVDPGTGGVTVNGTQTGNENYELVRFDWTMSAKDSIFARYNGDLAHIVEPFSGASNLWPYLGRNFNEFATVEEKHVFSGTLINTAHFGFSRPLQTLIINAHFGSAANGNSLVMLPTLADTTATVGGLTTPFGGAIDNPLDFHETKFSFGDDLIWSKGAHSLRFGGSIMRLYDTSQQDHPAGGSWTFNSAALFVQGQAVSYYGPVATATLANGQVIPALNARRYFRSNDYAMYIQDDWKVLRTLTLNLGVRYEPTSNPYELHHNLTSVVPPPILAGSTGTATTGFSYIPNATWNNNSLHNFDPRIGLAWDPFSDHKTSVRAGYGIFHAVVGVRDFGGGYDVTPPWATELFVAANALSPLNFPNYTSSPGTPTQGIGWGPYACCTPYQQQWNLFVQHEFFNNTIIAAGYSGSKGTHLISGYNVNPVSPTACPTCNFGQSFATETAVPGGTATQFLLSPNARVNTNFGYLDEMLTDGNSSYQSLQLSVTQRMSRGLQYQVSYVNSICTDTMSGSSGVDNGYGIEDPFVNRNVDRALCTYQMRSNLTVSALYALPFHGNRAIEGWQLSGLVRVSSGQPIGNVITGFPWADNDGWTGSGHNRPDYVPNASGCNNNPVNANPKTFKPQTTPGGAANVFWINTSCFAMPGTTPGVAAGATPVGQYGNLGRDRIIGPNYRDLDFSIVKNTKINERVSIQFRAEGFNILNRANFFQPTGTGIFAAPPAGVYGSVYDTSKANFGAGIAGNAGQITTAQDPREIQFGLKLLF